MATWNVFALNRSSKVKLAVRLLNSSVLLNKFSLVKNVYHNKEAGTYIDIDVSGTMREEQGDSKHILSHSLKKIKRLTRLNLKENNKEGECSVQKKYISNKPEVDIFSC